jgi:hypothetical protein
MRWTKKNFGLVSRYTLTSTFFLFVVSVGDYALDVINSERNLKNQANLAVDRVAKRNHEILDKIGLSVNNESNFSEIKIREAIVYYYSVLKDVAINSFSPISLFYISSTEDSVYIDQTGIYHPRKGMYPISQKQALIFDYYSDKKGEISDIYLICQAVKHKQHVVGQLCITDKFDTIRTEILKSMNSNWFNLDIKRIGHEIIVQISTRNLVLNYFVFITEKSWVYIIILWVLLLLSFIHYSIRISRELTRLEQASNDAYDRHVLIHYFKKAFEFRLKRVEKQVFDQTKANHLQNESLIENNKHLKTNETYLYRALRESDIDIIINYFHLSSVRKNIRLSYTIDFTVECRYFDVFVLQRLLMSLLTESFFKIDQDGSIDIVLDTIGNCIRLNYSDSSYDIDLQTINESLSENEFFIPEPFFSELIIIADGSIHTISTKYQKKALEIKLPTSQSGGDKNVIYFNRVGY